MTRFVFLFTTLISTLLIFQPVQAQEETYPMYDNAYVNYIRSVKFHLDGLPLSHPIIDLESDSRLALYFDDLEGEGKRYVYTIVHCDANWMPSDLSELEYIDGFTEDDIRDYDFSFNTRTNFTHYRLFLPNENMRWEVSGNYVLKIYDDEGDEKKLVLTRRFMVVEPLFKIDAYPVRTAMVSKGQTHQEMDFKVLHEGIDIREPYTEIQAVVMQNGRWDNAHTRLVPRIAIGQEMSFDYQNKIIFEAGKEFRYLDLRSLEYNSYTMAHIRKYEDRFEVTLKPELSRGTMTYLFEEDINGNFVIESLDNNGTENDDYESDYAEVMFTMDVSMPIYDADVYLYGAISDWQIKEAFKMTYNEITSAYVARFKLKQGFYNYLYAVVHRDEPERIDFEELEGNWYHAENEYNILVYYRPFRERYDRLVAAKTISSTRK